MWCLDKDKRQRIRILLMTLLDDLEDLKLKGNIKWDLKDKQKTERTILNFHITIKEPKWCVIVNQPS